METTTSVSVVVRNRRFEELNVDVLPQMPQFTVALFTIFVEALLPLRAASKMPLSDEALVLLQSSGSSFCHQNTFTHETS